MRAASHWNSVESEPGSPARSEAAAATAAVNDNKNPTRCSKVSDNYDDLDEYVHEYLGHGMALSSRKQERIQTQCLVDIHQVERAWWGEAQ